jgi:hypothetical protein
MVRPQFFGDKTDGVSLHFAINGLRRVGSKLLQDQYRASLGVQDMRVSRPNSQDLYAS